jgi:hypothetical protein
MATRCFGMPKHRVGFVPAPSRLPAGERRDQRCLNAMAVTIRCREWSGFIRLDAVMVL